jgi:hypothetical protein
MALRKVVMIGVPVGLEKVLFYIPEVLYAFLS